MCLAQLRRSTCRECAHPLPPLRAGAAYVRSQVSRSAHARSTTQMHGTWRRWALHRNQCGPVLDLAIHRQPFGQRSVPTPVTALKHHHLRAWPPSPRPRSWSCRFRGRRAPAAVRRDGSRLCAGTHPVAELGWAAVCCDPGPVELPPPNPHIRQGHPARWRDTRVQRQLMRRFPA